MSGVGEQRNRVGEEAGDDLDDQKDRGDRKRNAQPTY
jgi:hypothetical protein